MIPNGLIPSHVHSGFRINPSDYNTAAVQYDNVSSVSPAALYHQEIPKPGHEVIKVKRFYYVHILDNNTNVSRCCVGPIVFSKKEHESCLFEPRPCISVPARHYCVIQNPCVRDAPTGKVVIDPCGQVQLRMGDAEVRLSMPEPFPLYPGEQLLVAPLSSGDHTSSGSSGDTQKGNHTDGSSSLKSSVVGIFPLEMIPSNEGFHVRCIRDFVQEEKKKPEGQTTKKKVTAGQEWCIAGPQMYIPRVEVEVMERVQSTLIAPNTALRLRAKTNFVDRNGVSRLAGERWLIREAGAYLRGVEEQIEELQQGVVLSSERAIHLRALRDFTDVYHVKRSAGDMWLITQEQAAVHLVDVHEELVQTISPIVLHNREYAVILNPLLPGSKTNRYGHRQIRRGEDHFFLQPEEKLWGDTVQSVAVASKDEALLLKAIDTFTDKSGVLRVAGSTWMLKGPVEYVPEEAVEIIEKRGTIALDKNEGVYIMNTQTGEVRAVMGVPYMPNEMEVLWEKQLPPLVEELLARPHGSDGVRKTGAAHPSESSSSSSSAARRARQQPNHNTSPPKGREKFRVVRFHVQHNAAVQVNDYQKKASRIIIGPDLVILAPHEELTVLSLSGGTPKVPNAIRSLELLLGPRFSSDTIEVETSDHARLRLRLSYNWRFDRSEKPYKFFCVPDFIGDCCKTIASRVRGAVASEDFDSFHRNSADIIQRAVFGVEESTGHIREALVFPANNFIVTNIDVQSVEPTDEKTRDSLQKSVQLAIEITTKSQEAAARHGNELKDQKAKGQLERQKLLDKIEVEQAKTQWLELQAQSEAIQASGQSVAEAKAKAEALRIQVESELRQAKLRAKVYTISTTSELQKLEQRQEMELEYLAAQQKLEVEQAREVAAAESERVRRMVEAIGRDTLIAMARAGPELQAKLLGGLGLKGYLLTDGRSPVNLFQTAQGMLAGGSSTSVAAGSILKTTPPS